MLKYSRMIPIGILTFAIIALVSLSACSDDPSSNDQVSVAMQSELESSSVMMGKSTVGSGAEVDSIKVTRMRLFVRRMKLQLDKSDTSNDKNVKTDPFVITFAPQTATFANISIPAGSYDKVKFEFHKPENSQVAAYLGMPEFVDFVTNGQYTVIYDVTLFKAGVGVDFRYNSDVNANLSIKFDQPKTLSSGTAATFVLKVNPASVFKEGGKVLDPRDESNESKIDNNIKAAIKLHKR